MKTVFIETPDRGLFLSPARGCFLYERLKLYLDLLEKLIKSQQQPKQSTALNHTVLLLFVILPHCMLLHDLRRRRMRQKGGGGLCLPHGQICSEIRLLIASNRMPKCVRRSTAELVLLQPTCVQIVFIGRIIERRFFHNVPFWWGRDGLLLLFWLKEIFLAGKTKKYRARRGYLQSL